MCNEDLPGSPSHQLLLPLNVGLLRVVSARPLDLTVEGRFTQDLKHEDL